MKNFLIRWGNSIIEVLVLGAVFWSTWMHAVLWGISPTVLMVLMGLAFCLWAGSRLYISDDSAERTPAMFKRRPIATLSIPSVWIWAPICLLGILVIAQTIPLPAFLVGILSPKRIEMTRKLGEALPELKSGFLTLAVDPRVARSALPYFIFPLMAFILGNSLASSRRRARTVIYYLLLIVLAEAVYGLIEQLTGHLYVLWVPANGNHAVGTFANYNHFAAILSLFLPVTIGWLYFRVSELEIESDEDGQLEASSWDLLNSRQGLWLLAAPVLVLGIIQSQSRGGFASMIFGLAIMLWGGLRSRLARTFAAIGILLALGILIYAMSGDYQEVFERFKNTDEFEGDEGSRWAIWRNSLGIVRDYPVFGIGLGNFADVYRHYEKGNAFYLSAYQAHNEWLEGTLTFGLPCMILFAIAVGVCFVKTYQIIRRADRDKPWLLGVWSGLIGLALHSCVEFTFHSPHLAITAALLMGLLLGYERTYQQGRRHRVAYAAQ